MEISGSATESEVIMWHFFHLTALFSSMANAKVEYDSSVSVCVEMIDYGPIY